MPYDVIVGKFNPIALPVVLDFEPPKALGRAVFGVTYEGAPGCVHGAILAATFDIILTAANAIAGATGPTVRLALHYKRPTLTDEEAVFEGWVTEVTDRRVYSKGRIVQGGIVTVEADGEFAVFNQDGVQSHGQLEAAVVRRTAPRETLHEGRGTRSLRQSLQPSRDPAALPVRPSAADALRRDRRHGRRPPRGLPALSRGGQGRVPPVDRPSLRPVRAECG